MKIDQASWVYVLVQDPGKDENIVGQHDAEHDIDFIPAFTDKDTAHQGVVHMIKEAGQTYEVQAIIYEDLCRYAAEGQFLIFVLDGRGKIQAKLTPSGQPL